MKSQRKDIKKAAKQIYEKLPWEAIQGTKLNKFPSAKAISFLLDKSNYDLSVKLVLKHLQKTDPKKASSEYASTLVDMMKIISKMIFSEVKNLRKQKLNKAQVC